METINKHNCMNEYISEIVYHLGVVFYITDNWSIAVPEGLPISEHKARVSKSLKLSVPQCPYLPTVKNNCADTSRSH